MGEKNTCWCHLLCDTWTTEPSESSYVTLGLVIKKYITQTLYINSFWSYVRKICLTFQWPCCLKAKWKESQNAPLPVPNDTHLTSQCHFIREKWQKKKCFLALKWVLFDLESSNCNHLKPDPNDSRLTFVFHFFPRFMAKKIRFMLDKETSLMKISLKLVYLFLCNLTNEQTNHPKGGHIWKTWEM